MREEYKILDKWSLMRLYSVQGNLEDIFELLKENLLRYGYLVKANLPREYKNSLVGVDFTFNKLNEPCTVLQFDLKSMDTVGSVMDYYEVISELVGEDKIGIYQYNDTDLVFYIMI